MNKNVTAPVTPTTSVSALSLEQVGPKKTKREVNVARTPTPPLDDCRQVPPPSEPADYKRSKREVATKDDYHPAISVEQRKTKRKVSRIRLPTPPPDPATPREDDQGTKRDRPMAEKCPEFLEYLDSLQKSPHHHNLSRTNSAFAPAIATEDAFDHLEKLYKLMEQMLMLREQNTKLHRRVRDLEHLRNIQNMHHQLRHVEAVEVPEVDGDTAFAETLLDTILLGTKREPKPKQSHQSRFRQSILRRQRNRSGSINLERPAMDADALLQNSYRRASALCNSPDKPSKVSKWTKVKAAFKWERASQTVSDVKSQDSGIGGMVPVNYEVARYLRVPSTSEDPSVSPADSGAAEISTPGSISPASSAEDVFCHGRKGIMHEDTSDDDQSFTLEYIPHLKEELVASQKSAGGKGHRTPWAKMKDIIQTRNSFKKRNRLSAKSDDYKIEEGVVIVGSDNEDVFEGKMGKNMQADCQGCERLGRSPTAEDKHRIPLDVIAKYQQAIAEDNINRDVLDGSKWTRVKKAFLSSPSISAADNTIAVNTVNEGHFTIEDITSRTEHVSMLQEEIQKNYRELQNKLSLEFQDKMQEWEKIKQGASGNAAGSGAASGSVLSPEDAKDQAFKKKMDEWERIKGQPRHNFQLQSEEHLPPEFRKKLQEWQRIKKSSTKDDASSNSNSPKKKLGDWPKWKSISGHRPDASHLEYHQPLSDDFLKKLESWKQMKLSVEDYDAKGNKTPSPKLLRKDGSSRQSKKIKDQTEKELQWFEKELNKIEREKQRLERERQKFLEREERLTKLRLSVVGGNKKDILVHTPSGFYRFEGISRKFTQKLYEWEKTQGIAPEASTFALLSSCYVPSVRSSATTQNEPLPRLVKSKSADSVLNSELNLTHPLLSRDTSSLSLNDVDHLENECLLEARMSSVPDIIKSRENVDAEEPEAVIVEVEDIVEETAGPLEHYAERKHVPVYQKQETPSMCEGETRAAPKVQRRESTRAQTNYDLIEEIIGLLKVLVENENDIGQHEADEMRATNENEKQKKALYLKNLYRAQTDTSSKLVGNLGRLQDANTKVTTNIANEEDSYQTSRLYEVLDTVQDLSADLLQMAEKLLVEMQGRNSNAATSGLPSGQNIVQILSQENAKILDLRRVLSYLCAASDSTAPGKKKKKLQRETGLLRRSSSKEVVSRRCSSKDPSRSKEDALKSAIASDERRDSDVDLTAQIAQGAIKKRYRYRQKGVNACTLDESDDEDARKQRNKNKQKRSLTDLIERNSCDLDVVQKVAIPTKTNYVNLAESPIGRDLTDSPVQVFVKTTRKLFTPIVTSSFAVESRKFEVSESPTVTSVPSFHGTLTENDACKVDATADEKVPKVAGPPVSRLPPLPASPTPQRKLNKEISPNIRLMLVRYNQKIQEQEAPGCRSGGSSGSSSPVAWRSPVNERRVRTQTERYQQDLLKLSPLLGGRREVQKSASLGVVNAGNKQVTVHGSRSDDPCEKSSAGIRGILKSSSTNTLTENKSGRQPDFPEKRGKAGSLKLTIPDCVVERVSDPEARTHKLLKAKEDFLNSPVSPISAPALLRSENVVKYPSRNRLSQVSVGSESSYDLSACEGMLIKSASAGMINIDVDAYRQIDPEVHGGGYVSLPRSSKKRKESIISNIASKFRKVKMRRGKDPGKMNTISTLCRQSLVVDINSASQETLTADSRKDSLTVPSDSKGSSSGDTSPSTSRSGSWIKRPRLFKPKQ